MANVRVLVSGATGKMGQHTINAVNRESHLELVGGTCFSDSGTEIQLTDGTSVPLSTNLETLLDATNPDVVIDFTNAHAVMSNADMIISKGIHCVIGASGINSSELATLEQMQIKHSVGVAVIPMFAIGAVVLKKLASEASKFFDYVDIIEAHHENKIDAPSGFAMDLSRMLSESKQYTRNQVEVESVPNSRGGELNGVSIHSVRLPGRSAHHEIIFGAAGQTLSLKHDTLDREWYMPGVIQTVDYVCENQSFVVGLENILCI